MAGDPLQIMPGGDDDVPLAGPMASFVNARLRQTHEAHWQEMQTAGLRLKVYKQEMSQARRDAIAEWNRLQGES